MVFYESPHRLHRTLCDLYESLGEREIVIVKELTKVYENADYTKLSKAVVSYKNKKARGEYVIIIKNKTKKPKTVFNMQDAIKLYFLYLKDFYFERFEYYLLS